MPTRSTQGVSLAAGAADVEARAAQLAERMPDALEPLGRVAYNYRWSWAEDGDRLFRDISPYRWRLSGANPVHFLSTLPSEVLQSVQRHDGLRDRVRALSDEVAADVARPTPARLGIEGPIAFLCSEFGVHTSLPIYSGGLGVLAGDILKEASDQALPLVGVGLFYRNGYFHQRLDQTGRQLEYWTINDPDGLPMAPVTHDGVPLRLSVTIYGRETFFQVWRVDVGRVPLFLLDTDVPGNDPVQRWTTSRLYEGTRAVRLAQYALLGIGGTANTRGARDRPLAHPSERRSSGARCPRARRSRRDAGRAARGSPRAYSPTLRIHDAHPRPSRQRDVRAR